MLTVGMLPVITEWSLLHVGADVTDQNVDRSTGCHGTAFGHPRFVDGSQVVTSRVLSMDSLSGVLHTATRTYRLGPAASGYAALRKKHGLGEHIFLVPAHDERRRCGVQSA